MHFKSNLITLSVQGRVQCNESEMVVALLLVYISSASVHFQRNPRQAPMGLNNSMYIIIILMIRDH